MNWILLTLLAIIARAVYSLSTRLLSRSINVSPQTQSFLLSACVGLLSIIISPIVGGLSFSGVNQNFLQFFIIISVSVLGNIMYFKGQKHLDVGTTQIAFSSILIWGSVLSIIFLNSKFTLIQIVGILLMMIAIILVQNKAGITNINTSIFYIVGSALFFAVFQVTSASFSKTISTGAYLVLSYLGIAIAIYLFYFKKINEEFKELLLQIKNTFSIMCFASGTSILYLVFSYTAYRHAPDNGVVVILLTAQVILSVLLGALFLKEKENMAKKIFAGMLAFIAGILIKS